MKKITVVLLLCYIMAIGYPVFSDGIAEEQDGKDRVSIMEDLTIDNKTAGSIAVFIGDVHVKEDVLGNVVVIFGDVTVDAKVKGNIVNMLGNTVLSSNTEVFGNIISIGGFDKSDRSKVHGSITRVNTGDIGINAGMHMVVAVRAISAGVVSLLIIILGLIMIALSGKNIQSVIDVFDDGIGRKIAIGILGFLGATIISILLFITIIIPVMYFILMLVAGAVSGMYFGKVILRTFTAASNIFVEFAIGIFTIILIKIGILYLIPLHEFLWSCIVYLAFCFFISSLGIGILLDLKYGRGIKAET